MFLKIDQNFLRNFLTWPRKTTQCAQCLTVVADDYYEQLSLEEKEAFRRQQAEYVSPANLKQGESESVIKYVARMQRRFDLSTNQLNHKFSVSVKARKVFL